MNKSNTYSNVAPPTSDNARALMDNLQQGGFNQIKIFSFGGIWGGYIVKLDIEEETLRVDFKIKGSREEDIRSINLSVEHEHIIDTTDPDKIIIGRNHTKLVQAVGQSDFETEKVVFTKK